MKLLATIIALSGLAAAVPQLELVPIFGRCADPSVICTEKDMVENDRVKGNKIFKVDNIYCTVNQREKDEMEIDQASEICNRLSGCTRCQWQPEDRNQKRIGGRVAEFSCNLRPDAKNTDEARKIFREQIDKGAQAICESKGVDRPTCETYKLDCINKLSKDGPIIPDQMEWCVGNRVRI
ncbi:Zn(2)-C6 fungal-type DNA-binding domain protein [Metarhizium brunneum]